MSQKEQSKIDRFFKVKNSVLEPSIKVMPGKKKCNLSLSRTPIKLAKLSPEDRSVPAVIDLTSDDEAKDEGDTEPILNCSGTSITSNESNSTIIYSPATNTSSQTPKLYTPPSKRKIYSPSKKRVISVKSPNKVKRNLNLSMGLGEVKDEDFVEKTRGVEDKTIFQMRIVHECLNDKNLRLLLNETTLKLFETYMQAKPPGQTIVCRLYWQVEQWCRWDKIKKNACTGKVKKEKKDIKEQKGKNLKKPTENIYSKVDNDDPTVQVALNYLIENGLITVAQFNAQRQRHELNLDEMVKIANKSEIVEICKEFKIKPKGKEDGIQLLINFMKQRTSIAQYFGCNSNNESRVLKALGMRTGVCYKLAEQARQAFNELYVLMYLGMDYNIIREKNLELTLINEKSQQESYPVGKELLDNASVVFKSRLQFECYLSAHTIYCEFLDKAEAERRRIVESVFGLFTAIGNDEMMTYNSLPVWLHRFTPAYLYVKILEAGVIDLKRDKTKAELVVHVLSALIAQNTFRQSKKADWIAEKALVLSKFFGDHDQAARVLIEGINSDLPQELKQLLYPRAHKLASRKTNRIDESLAASITASTRRVDTWEKEIQPRHIYKVPMDNYNKSKLKFEAIVDGSRTALTAEEYCIHHCVHVEHSYTHGGHWEGKIVMTLFYLLFWDIIYARLRGVRGIFLSRFQSYPLDLYTDSFYVNRKVMIEDRLREIEESTQEDMLARMKDVWDSRPETEISGIHRSIGWENVCAVASSLGARHVAAVCRRLATQFHYAHSGFPDLTLWNTFTKEIVFVEVKTDNDKPSMKQKQWMHYLKDNKIHTEFCYIGVHTRRARSRNCGDVDLECWDSDDED